MSPEQLAAIRQVLHEAWLAVHVRRFDVQNGATEKPDMFYAGVIHSEQQISYLAERYGISWHQLRANPPACLSLSTEGATDE